MKYNKRSYKASKVMDSPIVENYLKGVRVNSKGVTEPLSKAVNKYNKELINEVNKLNSGFYKLVRTNIVIVKLIERYHGDIPEIRNINNLIYGQSGTIKYNRMFKRVLMTYGITHKDVYRALLKDIAKQQDRLKRNIAISKMLLDELGLNAVYKAVEDTTSMKFEDYLIYLEANNNIVKPSYIDEEAEKKYYEDLTNYQLGAIIGILDSHKINIDGTIQESLLNNRKRFVKPKKDNTEIQVDFMKSTKEKLNVDSCNIQRDIVTSYYEQLCRLSRQEATEIAYKVEKLGGVAYYIGMIRIKGESRSEICYCNENFKMTYDVETIQLFTDKQDTEDAIKKLQSRYREPDSILVAKAYKLIGTSGKDTRLDNKFYESHLNMEENLRVAKEQYNKTAPGLEKFKLGQRVNELESAIRATQRQESLCEAQQLAKEKRKKYPRVKTFNVSLANTIGDILDRLNTIARIFMKTIESETDQYTLMDMLDFYEAEDFECDNIDFMKFYNQNMLIDGQIRAEFRDCSDSFLNDSIDSYREMGRESIFVISILKNGKLQYFSNSIPDRKVCNRLTDDISSATVIFTRKTAQNKRDSILKSLFGSKLDKLDYPFEPIARVTEIKLQGENTNEHS